MRIYIASDHGGFKLKEELKKYLASLGNKVTDCGNVVYDPGDDYPDFAISLAKAVAKDKNNRGILICRNGVGVSIVANRHQGVRAVSTYDANIVKTSRADDNTNVLCLPADFVSVVRAKQLVKIWLSTPFSNAPRHKRRLAKINFILSNKM
jgi:RpiB/LacA/LacB family sugar-phosphate isomerase